MRQDSIFSLILSILFYGIIAYFFIVLFIKILPVIALFALLVFAIIAVITIINYLKLRIKKAVHPEPVYDEYGSRKARASVVDIEEAKEDQNKNQ